MDTQPLCPETIQDITPPSTFTSPPTQPIPIPTDTDTDSIPPSEISTTFASCIDLISTPLNPRILSLSDEFFAPATNLFNPNPPLIRPGVFVETGAWYDGWETRRHNPSPPDWVVVGLGCGRGRVRGVVVDTGGFDGNQAEGVEVWGRRCEGGDGDRSGGVGEEGRDKADERVRGEGYMGWRCLLRRKACGADRKQAWFVGDERGMEVTHVKLCMFPDGGIARFRLLGDVVPVWPGDREQEVELSAVAMGGVVVGVSDERFGRAGNLLLPGRGVDMGDGWETRRSRGRGEGVGDWVVVRLGARGRVARVVVDTLHFRGNFPRGVRVEGVDVGVEGEEVVVGGEDGRWEVVVGESGCERDWEHVFEVGGRVWTHLKLVILPDGGVKRFRAFGTRA